MQGRGGHPCVVTFGAFGGLKVMPIWMTMVTQLDQFPRLAHRHVLRADKAFTGTDSAETMESLARVATVKLGLIDSVALADDNFSSFNKVN
ncbi:hypothetical protein HGM15179_002686 [Zosterops borbonicus]|uniref:Uncharacterized protein n=1 Tax=Zosterops borbonicus TaxID=364589 RepID=A0A8K1GSD8_9PASS|nr:hypothetical protein HGM15179_002686 [Zosterops borbonicus]